MRIDKKLNKVIYLFIIVMTLCVAMQTSIAGEETMEEKIVRDIILALDKVSGDRGDYLSRFINHSLYGSTTKMHKQDKILVDLSIDLRAAQDRGEIALNGIGSSKIYNVFLDIAKHIQTKISDDFNSSNQRDLAIIAINTAESFAQPFAVNPYQHKLIAEELITTDNIYAKKLARDATNNFAKGDYRTSLNNIADISLYRQSSETKLKVIEIKEKCYKIWTCTEHLKKSRLAKKMRYIIGTNMMIDSTKEKNCPKKHSEALTKLLKSNEEVRELYKHVCEKDVKGKPIVKIFMKKLLAEGVIPKHKRALYYPLTAPRGGTPQQFALADKTRMITFGSTFAFLFVLAAPESWSNWNSEKAGQPEDFIPNWVEHIGTGFAWDKDGVTTNWAAHPFTGGYVYYISARRSGLGPLESFLYAANMSLFSWEMGIEALMEIPSIQDTISTPLGSILGEGIYQAIEHIRLKNKGKLFGSEVLGSIAISLLDPITMLCNLQEYIFDNLDEDTQQTYIKYTPQINLYSTVINHTGAYGDDHSEEFRMGINITVPLPDFFGSKQTLDKWFK